jgi:hypothetical protein
VGADLINATRLATKLERNSTTEMEATKMLRKVTNCLDCEWGVLRASSLN